ncbi:Cysteine-rich RLK (receptor-like protein kinase) 8 [Cucumis melo var. makuwa]|uniref:Cysteine-rich RLK (Receptor-like protein kinase) 8 n=1 Tax=Cucumis melo var. makuwa TaxID=1194695 RepID=A0A5D3BS16_CUCMM|nr:Cysteine-rich RLK (receptor-like protein kinase) 8 [Cucumis melo var. makuwa]TYK01900.1 Cysteine-rich RLK (receptor-like protein kinase) 8 [Cucumis melo var. makuwa]
MGQPSSSSVQPSGQKLLHAPPSVISPPIRFYASSPVQLSHPSGHLPAHALPIAAGQQPSKLSNLYSSANLYNSANLSVDPLQQPFFYRNGADQHHNKSGIKSGESSAPSGYEQPYVCGLGINQTYRRAIFKVGSSLAQTDLLMYCKNPVISLSNVPSNYITNSVAFSARSLTHDNGKSILVCEHCKKQRHTKDQCWKLHGWPPRGMSQSLGLISVDGMNPWILNSGVIDYLIVLFDGFSLQNVLHVLKLSYNLLSISKITCELHCKAAFLPESVCFQDLSSGRTIGTARHSRRLYILNDDTFGSSISTTSLLSSYFCTSEHDFMLWHFRDVWGPSKVTTSSGKSWFVNDHTRLTWVYLITDKSKVAAIFQNFYHTIETQFHKKIAILRSDDGWEFQNHNLNSCAYTPQQNGVAERKNRHLLEVARSLMLSTSLPLYLWGDAILTATHLINRMPSRILYLQTPLECLKESYPSTHLVSEVPFRVFGCIAYVHSFGPNQTKFIPRAQACMFVRRNLRKEVGSPTSQPSTPVQDSKPPRDQGMENPTKPCTNNTMNENDRFDVAVLENVEEKNSGDETEVRTETSNNEVEQGHTGKLDKYDPSLDLPIALRKGGTLDRHKARFTTFVKSQGYGQGHSDHTLFTKVFETRKIAVLIVYVDDIVLSGDDQAEISQLKQRMGNEFEINDLGNLKYFLGMEVTRSKEGISVSQKKYILDLLTETGMLGCRSVDTLIEFNCKLGNSDDQVPVDKEEYQRLMGKLIYLFHTRPDIFFAVSVVSQFMQAPYEEHMEAVKRILRYLKTTHGKGLMFRKTNRKTIEIYTDSDSAGSVVDRKSTSGYCTFVWGNLVTWRSKKQSVAVKSSAEAKYRAMTAISIANNPVQHDRTKHVEIDWHFIKERLDSGSICIPSRMTAPQAAGVIHSDFERGFIRAETVAYDDFVTAGSFAAAREKGLDLLLKFSD